MTLLAPAAFSSSTNCQRYVLSIVRQRTTRSSRSSFLRRRKRSERVSILFAQREDEVGTNEIVLSRARGRDRNSRSIHASPRYLEFSRRTTRSLDAIARYAFGRREEREPTRSISRFAFSLTLIGFAILPRSRLLYIRSGRAGGRSSGNSKISTIAEIVCPCSVIS